MELITIVSAKVVWIINTSDLNPKGVRLFPDLTDALTDTFDFDEQPDDAPITPSSASQPGIKFKNGRFETDQGAIKVGLEIYDDGFVAESSSSTEVTERFLKYALDWATTTFGLRFNPDFVMKRIYASELVIRFECPLSTSISPLFSFARLLSDATSSVVSQPFSLSGLTFASQPLTGSTAPMVFTIERRTNTHPDANVFYTKAPLTTETHIRLMGQFDELLAHL